MFRRTKLCIVQELIKEQLVNVFGHFKRDNVTRYFASGFFHESSSPKPLKMTLGSFKFFVKILGDILKSRCTTGINDTGSKFATGFTNTNEKFATGGKFATGVTNTNEKFATGISDTVIKLPPVLLVLLKPVAIGLNNTVGK
jgi:hypothetical protein